MQWGRGDGINRIIYLEGNMKSREPPLLQGSGSPRLAEDPSQALAGNAGEKSGGAVRLGLNVHIGDKRVGFHV